MKFNAAPEYAPFPESLIPIRFVVCYSDGGKDGIFVILLPAVPRAGDIIIHHHRSLEVFGHVVYSDDGTAMVTTKKIDL